MIATVCELRDTPSGLESDWTTLTEHVSDAGSDLVLLPEMPFAPWLCAEPVADEGAWLASVESHDRWISRLADLAPAAVLGTRPIVDRRRRYNEAFVWSTDDGYRAVHRKRYLPDEDGFWEASWYERGDGGFACVRAGEAVVGFLVCTELWFLERARAYGRSGAHIVASPRATPKYSSEKWLVGGQACSIVSGTYCLSSNRAGESWAGRGWVTHPEDGRVLGTTAAQAPILSVELDLAAAESARGTYPRYVSE